MVQLKQTVNKWWNVEGNVKMKFVYQVIPGVVLWHIWKWRNTTIHEGKYSSWPMLVQQLDDYRPMIG